MAPSQDLSTPQCPAEERAWLLVNQRVLGFGKPLTAAFNKQFPERQHGDIQRHATGVRDCKDEVQSQLQTLAKHFAWYKEPPEEGERGYKRMMKLERQKKARDRIEQREQRELQRTGDPTSSGPSNSAVSVSGSSSSLDPSTSGPIDAETPAGTNDRPQEAGPTQLTLAEGSMALQRED